MSIHELRAQVRHLLDPSSPADAPTAYYALYHNPARSALYTTTDEDGAATGFVGVFQTGIDLFRPLVTLHCAEADHAAELLARALTPERPYIFFAKMSQLPLVGDQFHFEQHRVLRLYRLDPRRFGPELNVLVELKTAPDGTPRAVIGTHEAQAVAGVNWQSPEFAEIYVQTDPEVQRRGWGRSVTAAVTQAVLESGRIPLYLVEMDNDPSRALAESLGYVDTDARQVYADVVYTGS